MVVGFLGLGVGGQINIADIPVVSFCADTLSDWHLDVLETNAEEFRAEAGLQEEERFDFERKYPSGVPHLKPTIFARMARSWDKANSIVNKIPETQNPLIKPVTVGFAGFTYLIGAAISLPQLAITHLTAQAHLRRLVTEEDTGQQQKLKNALQDLDFDAYEITMRLSAAVTKPNTPAKHQENTLEMLSLEQGFGTLYTLFQKTQEASPQNTDTLKRIASSFFAKAKAEGLTTIATKTTELTVRGIIITDSTLKAIYTHLPEEQQTEFSTILTVQNLAHTPKDEPELLARKLRIISHIDLERQKTKETTLTTQLCECLRSYITSSLIKGKIIDNRYASVQRAFGLLLSLGTQGRETYIELMNMISPKCPGRVQLLQALASDGINRNDALWGYSFAGCEMTAAQLDAALYNIASPGITKAVLIGDVTEPSEQTHPITDDSLHQLVRILGSNENTNMRDYAASRLMLHAEREDIFNVLKVHLLSGRKENADEIALALAKANLRGATHTLITIMQMGSLEPSTTTQLIQDIFSKTRKRWENLESLWAFLRSTKTGQSPALFHAIVTTQFKDKQLEKKRMQLLSKIIIGAA